MPIGVKADDGTLELVSSAFPIPISGNITASNPSVGPTGTPAPTSATEVGFINAGGNLVGVSAANPLPIAGTFSSSFTEPTLNVTGSASSAAVFSNFPVTSTVGYRTAAVQVTAYAAASTIVCEESNDGTTWSGIKTPNDLVTETATPITALGLYFFPVSGLQFRVRQSVYGGSGTSSVNVELRQETVALAQQAVSITNTTFAVTQSGTWTVQAAQSGTWNINNISGTISLPTGAATSALQTTGNSTLTTINTTLGSPFQAGGSIGNTTFASTQSGAWNVGQSGSWTVAATQSGTWNITNISGTVSLPTGAATAAKQPALGTAGTPSADVLTIQGAASMTAVKVDGSAVTQPSSIAAIATGGYTPSHLIAANTTNATSLKGSAGTVGFIQLGSNSTTAIGYLKLYDKATAPTVGTDVPIQTYIIPFATGGAGNNPPIPIQGLAFATGIAYAVTGGIADNDNTSVAAATFAINIGYK